MTQQQFDARFPNAKYKQVVQVNYHSTCWASCKLYEAEHKRYVITCEEPANANRVMTVGEFKKAYPLAVIHKSYLFWNHQQEH